MKDLLSLALQVEGGRLSILDQTRLPDAEIWLDGSDPAEMVGHIQRLSVRGAPLIGVAAALGLAAFAESGADPAGLAAAAAALRAARPTAVNLMWAMDRMTGVMGQGGACSDLVREAEAIFEEDVRLCEAMAAHALALFAPGEAVLTHCNSGGLATAGIGTALGAIRRAWEAGKVRHVYADETRPLLQGGRLTAWELTRLGIPFTLLTDSMAAILLRDGQVQRVLVGADRIARNGDFANKVGTYGLAVNARHHGVPFHAVAPFSTVDLACSDGDAIPIENRPPGEVRGFGGLRWAPEGAPVFNPSFDVTPARLLTSLVTDRGVHAPAAPCPRRAWGRGSAAASPLKPPSPPDEFHPGFHPCQRPAAPGRRLGRVGAARFLKAPGPGSEVLRALLEAALKQQGLFCAPVDMGRSGLFGFKADQIEGCGAFLEQAGEAESHLGGTGPAP